MNILSVISCVERAPPISGVTWPVDKATEFAEGLKGYLATSKAKYGEIIASEKKLTDEAETLLKEAINEYKQTFMAA